jgi:hypothetical protein
MLSIEGEWLDKTTAVRLYREGIYDLRDYIGRELVI